MGFDGVLVVSKFIGVGGRVFVYQQVFADLNTNKRRSYNNKETTITNVKGIKANRSQPHYGHIRH